MKKNTSTHKQKLLLVSAVSPVPTDSGGAVRAFHTLKELSKSFEIYYVYYLPADKELTAKEKSLINQFAEKSFELRMTGSKTHALFVPFGIPYWFSDWYSPEVPLLINRIIHSYNIKIVEVDFSQIFYILKYIPSSVYRIAGAIDISTVSFWRRLWENRNPVYFIDHLIKFLQVYRYESQSMKHADSIVVMSNNDEEFLYKLFPETSSKAQVVRNGVELRNSTSRKRDKSRIVHIGFIGSFNHPPNRAAVKYILTRVIPLLKSNAIPYKVLIAGDTKRSEINQMLFQAGLLKNRHIEFLGFVKDARDFYESIDLLLAPIFSGSGTRIKILESLSWGKPVISTTVGTEGVDVQSPYLFVTNKLGDMLMRIEELRHKNAFNESDRKALIEQLEDYGWEKIFHIHAANIKQAVLRG